MKKSNMEMERRQVRRMEKTLPVKLDAPDIFGPGCAFEALSRNIGEGGVFVETDLVQDERFSLDKEKLLNLEIELLGQARRIRPKGEIVWVSKKSRAPHKQRNGLGIRFIQITPEEKRAISIFISREMLAETQVVEKEIPQILREQKLSDRQRRNLQILNNIRLNRLVSRAEISKYTDINIVTVSNYIDTYLKKGLVFERGLDISTGGRRPELVEINPQYGVVLGVDLGPLNSDAPWMQAVACDFTSRMKTVRRIRRASDNFDESIEVLKDLVAEVCADTDMGREKLRGIGVGVCGIMDKFGGMVRNPLTGETFANYVSLKKELEEEFGLPVFVENRAACALFAEKWLGASLEVKSADNILYLFSENQCAMMLRGELYTGESRSAGLLNLFRPQPNSADTHFCWMDPACDCLLRAQAQPAGEAALTKEEAFSQGTKMGAKIAYLANLFNPQVVVLGRNFAQFGEAFLDGIRRSVSRLALREVAAIMHVIASALGDEASALGAASLVVEAVFANM